MTEDDQGLQMCFKHARLETSWIQELCTSVKIETLEGYIFFVNKSTWETEPEQHLQSIPALKDNRLPLPFQEGLHVSAYGGLEKEL